LSRPAGREASSGPAVTFGLSWLTYASYYLGRKSLSVVKTSLSDELGLGISALALIDTVYLVAYAGGQVPSGLAVDRWGARRVLVLGLAVSGLACALFAGASSVAVFALCFGLNGLAQATGWPGTTKLMAEAFTARARGRVMGWWSTCYQLGGIAATALATYLFAHCGWRAAFGVPALGLLLMAATLAIALPRKAADATQPASAPAARVALRSPVLYCYGAAYFGIKLIRYSLLFWLPYYLHNSAGLDPISSGYTSTAFEIGGLVGCIGFGYAADRLPRARGIAASLGLFGLSASLLLYTAGALHSIAWHAAALALIGALLFGPDALISGAAAQDAVSRAEAATAVALVNGLGSVGALFQGVLTVSVRAALGWDGLFRVFVGLAFASALCLSPAWRARPRVETG
jgi:OPA family glycerol-3-phosphate transporter-like MFS transporter